MENEKKSIWEEFETFEAEEYDGGDWSSSEWESVPESTE